MSGTYVPDYFYTIPLKRGYVLCLQSRIVFVAVFEAGSGQTFCLVIQTVDRIYNFLIIDNLIT